MTEIVQGSDEWHKLRVGKVTASRIADLMARTKSGYAASRANYLAELLCERLTGVPAERFTNAAMAHGTAYEDDARQLYMLETENDVEQVAFIDHALIGMSGASPDGQVNDDGLIEIKCPNTATHIDTLLTGVIPDKYQLQMLWQMACTGRQWCDFVSFDPRCPDNMRLFVKRFPRDETRIAEVEAEVTSFIAELDAKIAALAAAGYDVAPAGEPRALEVAA